MHENSQFTTIIEKQEEGFNRTSSSSNYVPLELNLLSAALRSNALDSVLPLFIFLNFHYYFFIHCSFSETTWLIHTKFSGIVYASVNWIIR